MQKPLSAAAAGRWPTEQQLLLLHTALLPAEAALATWRAWRVTADLDQLPPGGFGLLPLLAYNLQHVGIVDPLLDKCQGIYRRTWTQNQLHLRQLAITIQALQAKQLTPLMQGEVPLALAYYPGPGLRIVQQAHLVTPAAQAAAVHMALTEAGWHSQPTTKARVRALVIGHPQPQHFRQAGSDLVLVWQQAAPNTYPPLAADLWQQAQPLRINEVATQAMSATDLFLLVCTQGIADFWRGGAVQWLVDAMLLLRTADPGIDWPRLLELAEHQAFTLRLSAALQGLQQWVDAPISATTLSTLATQSVQPFERWEEHCYQRSSPLLGKGGALWAAAQRRRWVQERARRG